MRDEQIKAEANRLKKKFDTEDLYEICEDLKIAVFETPMGVHDGSCKGFFILNARQKLIALNSDLPEQVRRIILAHELGHAVLTCNEICAFHDFTVLSDTDSREYEANVFASEFLLEDGAVLAAVREEQDFFRIAQRFRVPPEMLDFKLRLLKREGHKIEAPYIAKSTFLKRNMQKPMN